MKRSRIDIWRDKGPFRRVVGYPQVPIGRGGITKMMELLECGHTKTIRQDHNAHRRRCRQCAKAIDQAAVATRLTMAGNPWPLRKIVGPSRLNQDMRSINYCRTLDPLECGHESPRTDSHSVTKRDLSGKRRRCRHCHLARTEQAEALAVIELDRASRNMVKGIER